MRLIGNQRFDIAIGAYRQYTVSRDGHGLGPGTGGLPVHTRASRTTSEAVSDEPEQPAITARMDRPNIAAIKDLNMPVSFSGFMIINRFLPVAAFRLPARLPVADAAVCIVEMLAAQFFLVRNPVVHFSFVDLDTQSGFVGQLDMPVDDLPALGQYPGAQRLVYLFLREKLGITASTCMQDVKATGPMAQWGRTWM